MHWRQGLRDGAVFPQNVGARRVISRRGEGAFRPANLVSKFMIPCMSCEALYRILHKIKPTFIMEWLVNQEMVVLDRKSVV